MSAKLHLLRKDEDPQAALEMVYRHRETLNQLIRSLELYEESRKEGHAEAFRAAC